MNDKTSHPLAVSTPLSKLYLALFSAPLLMLAPADIARADDAIFDGDSKITESLAYTGDVYVGRNQSGNLLIENGKISAYNINIGRMFNGQIHESVVTVRGPNAELNAVNDQFVLRGGLNLGRGTLRVEDGALASAKEIVVGTTRGYDSHLIATGAGSRVTSNFLSVGTDLGARSTLAIEDGAVLNTAFDARIGNGSGPGESDMLSPKATVTGANSQWNVGRALTLYGDLDVLNGGAVNVGNIQVAGVSGARKTAELTIAGSGSRFTSGSSVNVGDYGNGVLAVMDGGTFSAGGNEVVLGKTGSGSNRGALIIGSRGNMDTGTGLTEPTLGAAGAAGTIDAQTAIALRGGLFRSYVYFNHTDGNYVFSNKMSGRLFGGFQQLAARGLRHAVAARQRRQRADGLQLAAGHAEALAVGVELALHRLLQTVFLLLYALLVAVNAALRLHLRQPLLGAFAAAGGQAQLLLHAVFHSALQLEQQRLLARQAQMRMLLL